MSIKVYQYSLIFKVYQYSLIFKHYPIDTTFLTFYYSDNFFLNQAFLTKSIDLLLYMSIIISEEREITKVIQGMKEMKEMPMQFMEDAINAKINEIYDYRINFWDELKSEKMKDTFELYTKDMENDGYDLIREGLEKFYPNSCNDVYVEKVINWSNAVDEMLLDLRIELQKTFNIKNAYIELRKRKEGK